MLIARDLHCCGIASYFRLSDKIQSGRRLGGRMGEFARLEKLEARLRALEEDSKGEQRFARQSFAKTAVIEQVLDLHTGILRELAGRMGSMESEARQAFKATPGQLSATDRDQLATLEKEVKRLCAGLPERAENLVNELHLFREELRQLREAMPGLAADALRDVLAGREIKMRPPPSVELDEAEPAGFAEPAPEAPVQEMAKLVEELHLLWTGHSRHH